MLWRHVDIATSRLVKTGSPMAQGTPPHKLTQREREKLVRRSGWRSAARKSPDQPQRGVLRHPIVAEKSTIQQLLAFVQKALLLRRDAHLLEDLRL